MASEGHGGYKAELLGRAAPCWLSGPLYAVASCSSTAMAPAECMLRRRAGMCRRRHG